MRHIGMQLNYVHFQTHQSLLLIAAWLRRELLKVDSQVVVEKLCGDNSHTEKERVTKLFREG